MDGLSVFEAVLPGKGRRRWPAELKARIVAETLEPGVTVSGVAQRYGLGANRVSGWRRLAQDGKLVLPSLEIAQEIDADFVSVQMVADGLGGPALSDHCIDILKGDVTIRLNGRTSPARIAEIALAL